MLRLAFSAVCIAGVVALSSADEPAKSYRNVSGDQLEAVLKGLKIDFKKTAGKKDGVAFYDFDADTLKVRLHNYEGKDLWIDAHFTDKVDLDDVNKWNVKARATRAVLLGSGDKSTVSLEAQLDCEGGTSDAIIRQFVQRFERELKDFAKFISK